MTPKPRIPTESWESRKEVIVDLYLNQGKKLADVIEILAKDHSFYASKSQYITQLSKWKVEKYSSRDVWASASALVRKRKLEGKETEIYIDGKKVPENKLKKALSRPSISRDELVAHLADKTVGSSSVAAYTPRPDHTKGIEICGLPWFQFQSLLETSFINLVVPSLGDWNGGGTPDMALAGIAGGQNWGEVSFASDFAGSPGSVLENYTTQYFLAPPSLSEAPTTSTTIEQAGREARFVLGQCLSEHTDPDDPNYGDQISAILKETTIEQQEGELIKHVGQLFSKSSFDAAYQLLRYSAYLSSNDLLSFDQSKRLVRWLAQNENVWTIERLLDNQLPTIEIFCGNLLVAAAGLGEINFVKSLLSRGVDPNCLGGETYNKETALHQAATAGNLELAKLLLKAGASPDIYSLGRKKTALGLALTWSGKKRRPDIALAMTQAGAKVIRSPATGGEDDYLTMAAHSDSLDLVQAMLSAGAQVNSATGDVVSALQIAVSNGHIEMAEAMLAAGADVNYPLGRAYQEGRNLFVTNCKSSIICWHLATPLQLALGEDNMEMVQVLIEAGADVNGCPAIEYLPWLFSDSEEKHATHNKVSASESFIAEIVCSNSATTSTPLQVAVHRRNAAVVRLLLRLGADVNAPGGFATALQAAATVKEGCQLVRLLISNGANVNSPARGRGAMTALQAAASVENQEAVEALLQAKADINAPPSHDEGRTALQAAVETGNISLVRLLINAGAIVHAKAAPEYGKTCLQAAAEAGNLELIDLLLRSGAYMNMGPFYHADRVYALETAIENDQEEVISRLFSSHVTQPWEDAGLSLLITSAIGNDKPVLAQQFFAIATPTLRVRCIQSFLTSSIRAGFLSLAQFFIEAGANVNEPVKGETPVETAVRYGSRPAILTTLLEAGANVQGAIGAGAVRMAVTSVINDPRMLFALLSAGATPKKVPGHHSPLRVVTGKWTIREEIVRYLLLHGADPNEDAGRPLQFAAAKGCIPVVDLLLQAGANVNAPATCAKQKTALQGAVRTSSTDLVEKLLDAGADINALPSPEWGSTALQAAVDSGSSAMVRLLLSRGADVNGPPSAAYGATALQKAVIKGNLVITSLLLKHGADVNAPAAKSHGRTALEAAAEHGRLDILYLLLRYDGDPDTFSLRCRRAAKLAETSGHLVLARVMEEWRVSHCEAGTGGQ